jgi:hypothetical protein
MSEAGCDPFENGYEPAAVEQMYRTEIKRLRAVLEEFARQKTEDEMSEEEYDNADGWGAYETFIHRAREALK